MAKTTTNPCKIASNNYLAEIPNHFHAFSNSFCLFHNFPKTFDRLRPNHSATLFILEYTYRHPNCTRSEIKNNYRPALSNNTFQSILWAKLIDNKTNPRHYKLTKLGIDLLKYYNII